MKYNSINPTVVNNKVLLTAVKDISTSFPAQYIFCFGTAGYELETDTCFMTNHENSQRYFFLLVITRGVTRIEYEIQDHVNRRYNNVGTCFLVISYGLKTVNEAIVNGSRFFITVCRDGLLMYSVDGCNMRILFPVLDPVKTLEVAERHFTHRSTMAEGFLYAAEQSLDMRHHQHAIFLLHQCVEQLCIGMIRVFMAYRSDIHNSKRLLNLCRCFSPEPASIFIGGNEPLLDLLQRSYSEFRYKEAYEADESQAEKLYSLVSKLSALSQNLCNERVGYYHLVAGVMVETV